MIDLRNLIAKSMHNVTTGFLFDIVQYFSMMEICTLFSPDFPRRYPFLLFDFLPHFMYTEKEIDAELEIPLL